MFGKGFFVTNQSDKRLVNIMTIHSPDFPLRSPLRQRGERGELSRGIMNLKIPSPPISLKMPVAFLAKSGGLFISAIQSLP